ncbi:MAG TPA: TIGR04053 family radical SAM/SPASM domain-containing protein [Anaerolineae bacterium]|nr:TIGR04053 family radical SAM/SPASM domain-containing protein [Anaerolineae bacterium]
MNPVESIKGPHIIAWESTVACNLSCVHCRASAQTMPAPDELGTEEVYALIDQLAEYSQPIFVISGGEPLMRPDIYDIAAYGTQRGLRVAVSPNGTLLTPKVVHKLMDAGVKRISVSIDGSTAARHDAVRGVPGAFEKAMEGLARCRDAGLGFQLNTTVMRQTRDDLPAVRDLAVRIGADAWHVFMLVPTGRGKVDDEVSPEEYEEILHEIYVMTKSSPIPIRVTCGPHFMRIVAQNRRYAGDQPNLVRPGHSGLSQAGGNGRPTAGNQRHPGNLDRTTRGCLAGDGYCFVSYRGDVTPCGYFPVIAGNIREQPFREIYAESELFRSLRDLEGYGGKCGICEFLRVCGGCRARAYSLTGNYLAEEPYCVYQPRRLAEVRA